jgi:hypothetical protein
MGPPCAITRESACLGNPLLEHGVSEDVRELDAGDRQRDCDHQPGHGHRRDEREQLQGGQMLATKLALSSANAQPGPNPRRGVR